MYRDNKPICNERDSDSKSEKISKIEKGNKDTAYESIVYYSDGSCKVNWGGPCGSTNYDKYGEEC